MKKFGMMRRILSLFLGAMSFGPQGAYAGKKRDDERTKLARRTGKGNRNKGDVIKAIRDAKKKGHNVKVRRLRNGEVGIDIKDKKGNTTTYIVGGGLTVLTVLSLLGIGYWKYQKSENNKDQKEKKHEKDKVLDETAEKAAKEKNETELEDKGGDLKKLMISCVDACETVPIDSSLSRKYFGSYGREAVTEFKKKINDLNNDEFAEILKSFRRMVVIKLGSELNRNYYFVKLRDGLQSSRNDLYGEPDKWDKISKLSDIELFEDFINVICENGTLLHEFRDELKQTLTKYYSLVGDLSGISEGTINVGKINEWGGVDRMRYENVSKTFLLLKEKIQHIEEHNSGIVNIEPNFYNYGEFLKAIGDKFNTNSKNCGSFLLGFGWNWDSTTDLTRSDFYQILFSYKNMKKVKIDVEKCKERIGDGSLLKYGDFRFLCGKNGLIPGFNSAVALPYDNLAGREFYPSALAMAAFYVKEIDAKADVGAILQACSNFLEREYETNLAKIGEK